MITSPTSLTRRPAEGCTFQRQAELPVGVSPAETEILGVHLARGIALNDVVLVHLH